MSYRYIVVTSDRSADENQILLYTNDKESLEQFIQTQNPRDIEIYEHRYVSENVLSRITYEDEMTDKSDNVTSEF